MSFFNKKKKIQKKLVVSSKFIKRSSNYIRKQIRHNPFKVFPSNDNFFEEDEDDYFSLNEIDDESKMKKNKLQIEENNKEDVENPNIIQTNLSNLTDIKHENHDFICPICLRYIVAATTTHCGHTFCEICISEYLLFYSKCPQCKSKLRKHRFGRCLLFDSLIEKFLSGNDVNEYEDFLKRVNTNKDWNKNKKVKSFSVGDKIDVRDPRYIWCEGTIQRIINRYEKKAKYVVIHYEGLSHKYDEEISEHSQRFAPLGFYTGRTDIPKYNLTAKVPFFKKLIVIPTNKKFMVVDDSSSSSDDL